MNIFLNSTIIGHVSNIIGMYDLQLNLRGMLINRDTFWYNRDNVLLPLAINIGELYKVCLDEYFPKILSIKKGAT